MYHTTPYSTIKDTLFTIVYCVDVVLPDEIDAPTWKCAQFNEEEKETRLRCATDLIDEIRDVAHVMEFSTKQGAAKR